MTTHRWQCYCYGALFACWNGRIGYLQSWGGNIKAVCGTILILLSIFGPSFLFVGTLLGSIHVFGLVDIALLCAENTTERCGTHGTKCWCLIGLGNTSFEKARRRVVSWLLAGDKGVDRAMHWKMREWFQDITRMPIYCQTTTLD